MKKEKNTPGSEKSVPEPAFLKQYRTCYPRTRRLYMTSDRMIFPDDLQAAVAHQKGLKKGKLTIYLK
ncbi:MAG: hypothetical protein LUF85_04400 [Bacteroides sp.]|nr:hypothetical protein [Bacteroides sp.]